MANVDLSDLAELTAPADDDKLLFTDDDEGGGEKSKYVTYSTLHTVLLAKSFCHRARFAKASTTTMTVQPGRYFHNGTTAQLVYWDSALTVTFANLAASTFSYLYLDDSAIVTAATPLLTNSEFIDSTTSPSWSAANHGWYNGSDMCIGAFKTNSSSEIDDFYHWNNYVEYKADVTDVSENISATTWEDHTLTIPAFCQEARATVTWTYDNNASVLYYRPNGSSGSGIRIGHCSAGSVRSIVHARLLTGSSQGIELLEGTGSASTARIQTNGWFFPPGM
jgi:hypothetical protein